MGQIRGEDTYLNGGMQVHVSGTRKKRHCLKHEKILNGYEDFNIYVVVGSLRATNNSGRLDEQHHVMTLEYGRVVSSIFHNNK